MLQVKWSALLPYFPQCVGTAVGDIKGMARPGPRRQVESCAQENEVNACCFHPSQLRGPGPPPHWEQNRDPPSSLAEDQTSSHEPQAGPSITRSPLCKCEHLLMAPSGPQALGAHLGGGSILSLDLKPQGDEPSYAG